MITREQYVNDLRKRHPNIYRSTMPDELVYHMGRQSDPYADVEDWKEMGYEGGKKIYTPQADVSPSGWNELVLKDIDDDSWEWVKHAYANSLQGTLDQWYNGKLDYNIERDYDELNIGEKILAGVGSFLMPLDLLTLRIGAPVVGSVMGAGLKAVATKAGAKEVAESAVVKGLIGKANALGKKAGLAEGSLGIGLNKAIMSGNTIGLYEAAKGGLAADIAGDDPFEGTAHGYVHGAMIGGVMGGVGGAMESNFLRYKMLKEMKIGKRPDTGGGFGKQYTVPELEKLMKYTGKHGQYAAEVASLQAFNITDTIKNGELKGDQLLEQLIIDAGFVKLMGVKNRALSKVIPTLKKYRASLDKSYEDFKRTRDMGTEAPFNPKNQVFSEKSEINNIIREHEGKTNPESLKIVEDARQAQKNLEDNLKPNQETPDPLPILVRVDNLIKEMEYLNRRDKETMNLTQIEDQINAYKNVSNKFLEAQGEIIKGLESGIIKDEIWRPIVNEGYENAIKGEENVIQRKTKYKTDRIEAQTRAKKLHSELPIKQQYSKKDFDAILASEEATNNFIKGMKPATGSEIIQSIAEQVKKSKDYKKDVEKKYKEGTDARVLADELLKDWTKIEKDIAGFKEDSVGLKKLEDSKKIVGYFAQNEMIRKGATVSEGLLKSGPKRIREMYAFAKDLAKNGKSFEDMRGSDVESWLLTHSAHATMMNELVPFLKQSKISPQLFIGKARISKLGKKAPAWGKEGFRTDHESWAIEKDKLLFRVSKQTEDVEKPISKNLSKNLTKLAEADLPAKEGHKSFMFRLNTGEAMVNEDLMSMWNGLFKTKYYTEKGEKKIAGARAMRKTLQQFAENVAAKRLKIQPDYAKKIVTHHLLKDRPDMKAVDKAYGADKQIELARKIVEEFVKEVNKDKPVKYKQGEEYYTPIEIKRGLDKLAGRKEVFRMDGRQYSKEMLEPMIQYIIETTPRINEIVPDTKALNLQLKQAKVTPKEPKAELKVGDIVQWTSQGVDQFKTPKKITQLVNGHALVEGSKTGIPIKELSIIVDKAPDKPMDRLNYIQKKLEESPAYQKLREIVKTGTKEEKRQAKQDMNKMHEDMTIIVPVKEKGFDYRLIDKTPDKPPAPPARDVDIAVGYIKKSKIPHEKPSLAGKLKSMVKKEQKSDLADKDIVINALSGTPEASGYKIAAKQIVNNFIERHMEWRDFVSKNPNALKKNPNIGDVAFHNEWIKNYKYVLKSLEKAPSKLSYGEFAGKNERTRLVSVAKKIQKEIGISEGEKQLGRKSYEKQLFEDTEGLFGKGVKSLGRNAENALTTDNLYDYVNFIGSENYLKTNRKWRGRKQVVDDLAIEYGVKNSDIKEKLKSIGVKDGEWENIQTKSTVDYILSWISGHEKLQPQKSHSDMMIEKMHSDTFGKFPGAIRRFFTSPMQIFFNEKLVGKGGQKIIQPFADRLVTKKDIVGIKNKYTNLIKKEVPNIKDMDISILLKDTEIQKFWRKNGELTSKEIRMIDNSYKEGTWEYRVKKHLQDYTDEIWGLWSKYGEEVTKNPRIKEQLEDLLGKMYQEDYYMRRVNPKLLEAIESSTKFFEEATGLEKMMAEETTKYINAQIRKNITKPVKKDFKKDSQFKKALDKYKDDVIEERTRLKNDNMTKATVADIVYNYMTMKPHKLKNPAFMERGVLFPRYVTIKDAKGKTQKIKSYLENWNDSFDYYGNSQADHLSTWRHVPEFSSLGKKLKVGSWKNNLLDYLSGRAKAPDGLKVESKWSDYIGMWLEAELGMEGSYKERHNRGLYRVGGILASTGAVMGMSAPILPGFKNVSVGFTADMAIRPLSTTLQGWLKTFDPVHRKKQGEKGYTNFMDTVTRTQKSIVEEIGLTEKIPLGKYLTTESVFKFNLVSPTEDIARISSSTANRLYAQQLVDAVKGHKNIAHKYMGKKMLNKQFEFTAKNLFKWTPEEIQFIKNTKYEDLHSKTKTNPYTETNNSYQYSWMMKKAEFFGQGATQGLTDPITLPLWMSSGAWRPLTLFTRMATSVTAGMWTNTFRPIWEVGNPMPLVRYAAGSVFTGAGLYAFYKYIMGQDQMHEMSDDKWKTVLQMAWRAEFLGMFSHVLNPHSSPIYGGNNDTKFGVDPSFATDFFEPYMIRSGRALVEGISTVMTDPSNPKGWTDAINHVTKTSVSLLGHTSKQWDRLFYPEVKEWNKFRTAARSFKKEKGYDTPQFKLNTARQVYYRDLKNNFWRGDEKEFAKSYYAALAQIDTEMLNDGYISQAYRRKQAMRSIEQSLKSMNPVNFSAEIKGREMSKRSEFLNYLKNYDKDVYRQALNSEKTFNFKLRKLLSVVQQSKYKLNYSPYYDRY